MVVLAVGLVGLAGLQVTGLRNNHQAYLLSQATVLADDIVEAMRNNRLASYATDIGEQAPTVTGGCVATVCGRAKLAAYQLHRWKARLSSALPAGDGAVVQNATGEMVTVTVQWDDSRGAQDPVSYATSTQL